MQYVQARCCLPTCHDLFYKHLRRTARLLALCQHQAQRLA